MQLASPFVIEERALWTNPNEVRADTTYIVMHHAATFYPQGRAVQKIYEYHAKKWPDYHAAAYAEIIQIEAGGDTLGCHIMYPPDLIGAGVWGRNEDTFHICAATNFTAIPSDEWIEALARRVVVAKQRYPNAIVVGHKDIALKGHETECPGQLWNAWKLRLLGRVAAIQQAPKVRRFRVMGWPVYQRKELNGTLAGHLAQNEVADVDTVYQNGAGHLASGLGFIDLNHDALEELP